MERHHQLPVSSIVPVVRRQKIFLSKPLYSTVRNTNTGFFYWAVKPQNDRLRFFEKSQTLNAGQKSQHEITLKVNGE
jgi:hypothetical protein